MQSDEQNRIFTEWLEAYQGLLFKIVSVYAFTPSDRDDLFQEIAVQLWRSIPSFRQECAPKSWIYRVALNYAIAWTKREAKYQKGKHPFDERVHVLTEIDNGSDDRLRWLYACIGELDRIDRSLALMFLDGFSHKEIAAALGVSETNVGVKIHRLKSRLAQLVRKEEIDDD